MPDRALYLKTEVGLGVHIWENPSSQLERKHLNSMKKASSCTAPSPHSRWWGGVDPIVYCLFFIEEKFFGPDKRSLKQKILGSGRSFLWLEAHIWSILAYRELGNIYKNYFMMDSRRFGAGENEITKNQVSSIFLI